MSPHLVRIRGTDRTLVRVSEHAFVEATGNKWIDDVDHIEPLDEPLPELPSGWFTATNGRIYRFDNDFYRDWLRDRTLRPMPPLTEPSGTIISARLDDEENQPVEQPHLSSQYTNGQTVVLETTTGTYRWQLQGGGYVMSCWISNFDVPPDVVGQPVLSADYKDFPDGGQQLEIVTPRGTITAEQRTDDEYGYGASFIYLGRA